jgi:glycosyltransferase involved in cell wall biosynthesis
MRIVHVVLQLRMGGQERFILNHSRELTARGHEVTVISMSEGGDLRRDFGPIPTTDVLFVPGGSKLIFYARLARALRELRPDVVHTHNSLPLIYAAPAARMAGVRRVVHTKHGANPNYTIGPLLLARLAARTLTAFVAVSEGTAETARAREHPSERILSVIPNGVPLEQFGADPSARGRIRAELGIPPQAVVIGTVGRLAPEKDYPFLVRSVAPILGDKTRLVLVGEGGERGAIEAAITEHLPPERRAFVRMTGARSDVAALFASFDLFVMSSKTEGLPLVVPEAMASRLPIVATAVGGLPSIVPREVGRLVPHGDEAAMRGAIEELLGSPEKRRTLGDAAHAYAHERFTLARMTTEYERLYCAV